MYDLVERVFISYICDLLRPHPQGDIVKQYFEKKIYKTKSGEIQTKVYSRWTNHKLHREAKRFFNPANPDFKDLCDFCDIEPLEIITIINHCIKNNEDRLYGKRAMRAYFKAKRMQND